ncbi:MAG: hypothetical protein EP335_16075 [Alphaproteobacteria bacterium]|nr:MAG: hypothetical protein EP335_16075 [Alphaproteobacteria bacterium]
MTSPSILPSTGPAPPELRRPYIPAHLRPDLPNPTEKLVEGQSGSSYAGAGGTSQSQPEPPPSYFANRERDAATGQPSASSAGRNLADTAAIQVQINESVQGAGAADTLAREIAAVEGRSSTSDELSDEDKAEVSRLSARDREVRAHEAAHASAGQGFAGSPSFDYVRGPDGIPYAVGGHVQIDVREVPDNPSATIAKMEVVQRAALAPARPSGQDRAVAAAAAEKLREAERQLANERRAAQEALDNGETPPSPGINLIA